jgi:hypothetical protein
VYDQPQVVDDQPQVVDDASPPHSHDAVALDPRAPPELHEDAIEVEERTGKAWVAAQAAQQGALYLLALSSLSCIACLYSLSVYVAAQSARQGALSLNRHASTYLYLCCHLDFETRVSSMLGTT